MKKKVYQRIANAVKSVSVFTAGISAGTASSLGIYQPKVPKSLQK